MFEHLFLARKGSQPHPVPGRWLLALTSPFTSVPATAENPFHLSNFVTFPLRGRLKPGKQWLERAVSSLGCVDSELRAPRTEAPVEWCVP